METVLFTIVGTYVGGILLALSSIFGSKLVDWLQQNDRSRLSEIQYRMLLFISSQDHEVTSVQIGKNSTCNTKVMLPAGAVFINLNILMKMKYIEANASEIMDRYGTIKGGNRLLFHITESGLQATKQHADKQLYQAKADIKILKTRAKH